MTLEDVEQARILSMQNLISKLEKANQNLEYKLNKYMERNNFLEQAIETSRQDWVHYGSDIAIKQLVHNLRTNKINIKLEP